MDQIFGQIGDTVGGFFNSAPVQFGLRAIGIYLIVIWLASAYWAFRDMQQRSDNPILPYVDRVLYLVDGRFQIGTVEQVMNTETLSRLYRADIQVVRVNDRYVVIGEDSGYAL